MGYRTGRLILVSVLSVLASGLVATQGSANAIAARLPHRHDGGAARHRRARQARAPDPGSAPGRDHCPRGRRAARGEVVPARSRARPADGGLSTPGSGVVQPDPLRRVTLVSLVFDHLGQNARKLAQKAAQDYLKKPLPTGQWVAVFSLDNRLHMLQDFSRNVGALSAAVDRATATVAKEGRRAVAGGEPGAGRPRPVRAAGRWCRGQSGDRGRRRGGAADARDDRAHADAGDQHRDLAARPRDVLSADGAGQGAGRPRGPEGDPALLGGPAGAQRGRGDLPGDDQRSQPRQRERVCDRRPRPRYEPRPGRRRRGARQGRPRQPAGDGQARRRRHVDGRSAERRPRALDASSPARSRCCASWPRTPAAR